MDPTLFSPLQACVLSAQVKDRNNTRSGISFVACSPLSIRYLSMRALSLLHLTQFVTIIIFFFQQNMNKKAIFLRTGKVSVAAAFRVKGCGFLSGTLQDDLEKTRLRDQT